MGLKKREKKCGCVLPFSISTKRSSIPSAEITLRKLIAIMEEQSSAKFYDRQTMLLNEFLIGCPYAFWLQDLAYVTKLIDLSIDRSQVTCLFGAPVSKLLSLCYHPPMLMKSSDILTFSKDLQEYFSFLGYLLIRLSKTNYQKWILKCIHNLLTVKAPLPHVCELKYRQKAIEESRLANIISELIELGTQNNFTEILEIAILLNKVSNVTSQKMIRQRLLQNAMLQLDETWHKRRDEDPHRTFTPNPEVERLCKITWTLIEQNKKSSIHFQEKTTPPDVFALWSLRLILQHTVKDKKAKLLRNNIAAIILNSTKTFPGLPFLEAGIVDDICILSVLCEIGAERTWAVHLKFTTTELDYEFKKICLLLICLYAQDPQNLLTMEKRQLIPGLLLIIMPKTGASWHPQLQCNLTIAALNTLEIVAPLLPFAFIENNGPLRVLILIEYYITEPYNETILEATLKCLSVIANSSNDDIILLFKTNSASYLLTTLCQDLIRNNLTTTIQNCLSYAFNVLETVNGKFPIEEDNIDQFYLKIINRLIDSRFQDSNFNEKFIVSTVDFIWEGLIRNRKILNAFVTSGGVFQLLDFIKSQKLPLNITALGLLVDLCEGGSYCISQIVTWRKEGKGIQEFLLELFREENRFLGVPITPQGIIEDVDRPLMSAEQQCEITCGLNKTNELSATINNLLASSRPKIYAIFQLLNSYYKDRTAIINDCYLLYTQELNANDQITMLLVHNFLRLKYGEAWEELKVEVDKGYIEPLESDQTIINDYVKGFRQWSRYIRYSQQQLLLQDQQKEIKEEKSVYKTLKDAKLAPTLEAFAWADYITRTTEALFRITRKMKYNYNRNTKLELFEIDACTHLTFFDNITVTPVFNHVISVESDVIDRKPNADDFLEELLLEGDESQMPMMDNNVEVNNVDSIVEEQ